MKSLLEVLEEIAHYRPDTVLMDRKGHAWTIKQLIFMLKRGMVKPKAGVKKKQFFGGMTVTGKVSIARAIPKFGSATILLEGERPQNAPPHVAIDFE